MMTLAYGFPIAEVELETVLGILVALLAVARLCHVHNNQLMPLRKYQLHEQLSQLLPEHGPVPVVPDLPVDPYTMAVYWLAMCVPCTCAKCMPLRCVLCMQTSLRSARSCPAPLLQLRMITDGYLQRSSTYSLHMIIHILYHGSSDRSDIIM